jgi:hypothetical protein
MPNHITNILKVEGSPERVKELLDTIKGEEANHLIDFNKIVPMPETLHITSGSVIDNAIALLSNDKNYFKKMLDYPWVKEEEIKNITQLKRRIKKGISKKDFEEAKLAIKNIEMYGHKDWYSWSNANWGTKWNSYDNARVNENTISFDTAWSTPFPVMEKLSEMFTDVTLHIAFADEDIGNNCGFYVLIGGKIQKEYLPSGYEATKFALNIKGGDYGLMDFISCNLINLTNDENVNEQELKEDISEILSSELVQKEFLTEVINNHEEEEKDKIKQILKDICIEKELYELIKDIESM